MLYTNEAIKAKKEKNRKIKNKLIAILYIILIPCLLYNISLIVQSVINPNETPSFFGIKTYVIISGSMEPELEIGDIVIVKEQNDYDVGDVISFRQGQSFVTHRITEIMQVDGEIEYVTKGDSNNTEDNGSISKSLIEGKVINKISKLGNLILFLQNKFVIIIIVVLLYIVIARSGSKARKKGRRRQKRLLYEEKKNENKIDIETANENKR